MPRPASSRYPASSTLDTQFHLHKRLSLPSIAVSNKLTDHDKSAIAAASARNKLLLASRLKKQTACSKPSSSSVGLMLFDGLLNCLIRATYLGESVIGYEKTLFDQVNASTERFDTEAKLDGYLTIFFLVTYLLAHTADAYGQSVKQKLALQSNPPSKLPLKARFGLAAGKVGRGLKQAISWFNAVISPLKNTEHVMDLYRSMKQSITHHSQHLAGKIKSLFSKQAIKSLFHHCGKSLLHALKPSPLMLINFAVGLTIGIVYAVLNVVYKKFNDGRSLLINKAKNSDKLSNKERNALIKKYPAMTKSKKAACYAFKIFDGILNAFYVSSIIIGIGLLFGPIGLGVAIGVCALVLVANVFKNIYGEWKKQKKYEDARQIINQEEDYQNIDLNDPKRYEINVKHKHAKKFLRVLHKITEKLFKAVAAMKNTYKAILSVGSLSIAKPIAKMSKLWKIAAVTVGVVIGIAKWIRDGVKRYKKNQALKIKSTVSQSTPITPKPSQGSPKIPSTPATSKITLKAVEHAVKKASADNTPPDLPPITPGQKPRVTMTRKRVNKAVLAAVEKTRKISENHASFFFKRPVTRCKQSFVNKRPAHQTEASAVSVGAY